MDLAVIILGISKLYFNPTGHDFPHVFDPQGLPYFLIFESSLLSIVYTVIFKNSICFLMISMVAPDISI